jgi:putative tricarboxylic transport membrane protein
VAIIGVMQGALYGDSVPACLINTPGTPSAIATTFDGFPLTKQGKGQYALVSSGISSAVGALTGGLALLFLSPPLAEFSLRFGPPEFFWIGLFGLTIIASLSGGSLLKGFAGGALGALLSTVGIALAGAQARYTFGVVQLQGGINIVGALVGLFAVPQALRLIEEHAVVPRIASFERHRGVFTQVINYLIRRPIAVIRSCVIGIIVGILPGAGGPIASLVSYNEAMRWSKRPERFGKGEVEGLVSAESANNAASTASFIPLLTLGVPGSPPAAIALGALLLHGLQPGEDLYDQHPDVVYTFMWSTVWAGLVIMALSAFASRFLVRIATFPIYFLAPVILVLSVVGALAIRNSFFDVAVMIAFGLLGYALDKLGFSSGPIVLGLILGPIIESNFVSSLALMGGSRGYLEVFVLRPLSLVLIALTILSALWPLISRRVLKVQGAIGGD